MLLVGLESLVSWRAAAASHDRDVANVSRNNTNAAMRDDKSPLSMASAATKSAATVVIATKKIASASSSDPQTLRAGQGLQEVSAGDAPVVRHPPGAETEMLRRQVAGFDKLIHRRQAELAARDAAQADNEKLIQSLRQENEQLRHQQPSSNP